MRIRFVALFGVLIALHACAPSSPPVSLPPSPVPALPSPSFDNDMEAAAFPRTAPVPGPVPALTLPSPDRRRLANGLEVVYVHHGSLPLIHATLITPGGSVADPAAAPGLASFVAAMLDEGAGGKDALELSAALELLGAQLGTGAGIDAAVIDLQVLRDRFPEAVRLMADVAARPDFPEEDLRRLRDERVTALNSARDEPRIIANNAFSAIVYGSEHPYGRLPTVASTGALDRAALIRFPEAYYRPEGSTLLLVGDVDPAELHPEIERAFGGWSGEAAAVPTVAARESNAATRIFLIDKPEAAQSEIRVGHVGVARDTDDFFPLAVLNTILGGAFTSRLNMNLRETHGFAYGASSSFAMRRGAGPFMAGSAVFTAKTDSAVAEVFSELRRIREEPVSADELDRARNYVALGFPRRFETAGGVASQLADLEVYDLSMDFYNDYVRNVMAVTAADVQRVAREYLRPDRSVVVVVGDVSQIETGLRALPFAEVELREAGEFVR